MRRDPAPSPMPPSARRDPATPWRASGAVALLALALVAGWASPARGQSSEADVDVAQAILAYEDRRYDDALALLRQALAVDPDSVDALYYTGLALMAQGKSREAVAPLERARRLAPGDLAVAYQLGLAHFTLRDYGRAEPLLAEVLRREPRADGIGYYVGFMRYQRRDYPGALDALGTGGATDPAIQQLARMYKGLALAALGRSGEAIAEVDAAVRIPGGAPLTGPAERFREGLRTAGDRSRRWRVEARVGILYDTNAPVLPEPSHDFTAEQARRDRDRHTLGELFAVNLEYAWLRSGPWEGTLGYSFLQIVDNDLPDFSVQSHQGTVGLTYSAVLGRMPYQLGASYAFEYLTLDDREFLQRHTITTTATLVESAMHLSALQARIQVKEFSRDSHIASGEVRDAVNWMLGLLHVLRFSGDRHFLRLGYQLDEDVAEGRNFDYVGHRVLAGGQYTLPWGGTRLRYDYDVHFRNYRHRHTVLPEVAPNTRERADTEQTHVARVEQPLPLRLTLAFEYQGIIARSNLPLFSYNRNIFSLILSWQY